MKSEFEIVPLPYALGAEVKCDDVRALSDDAFETIYQAWLDHLALVFKGPALSDPKLMDLARHFGELTTPTPTEYQAKGMKKREEMDFPLINTISNVKGNDGTPIGGLGDGEAQWHTDSSFTNLPFRASVLHALEIPNSWGGETGVLNMYAALETLPKELKTTIQGRTIKNDLSENSVGWRRRGIPDTIDVRVSPGPSHPIIRTHPETGLNTLYLGRRRYAYIHGLPVDESEDALNALYEHACRDEFAYHHDWSVGDILIWDNRCTMHHRNAFDPEARRIMHRAQTKGTVTYYDPVANSRAPHPRSTLAAVH
ncbi:MAG: TauD/TfdA family dioxygenase [Rhodospirillaceae bacterium]|jgi:taurine dioxygenase